MLYIQPYSFTHSGPQGKQLFWNMLYSVIFTNQRFMSNNGRFWLNTYNFQILGKYQVKDTHFCSTYVCVCTRDLALREETEIHKPCKEIEYWEFVPATDSGFFREKCKAFSFSVPVRTILLHCRHRSVQRGEKHNGLIYPEMLTQGKQIILK